MTPDHLAFDLQRTLDELQQERDRTQKLLSELERQNRVQPKAVVGIARALAQLNTVSSAWDGRLRRIKRLAEALHNHETRQQ